MERNDTLRNLLISGGVFLLILLAWPKLLPMPPQPTDATTTTHAVPGDSPSTQAARPADGDSLGPTDEPNAAQLQADNTTASSSQFTAKEAQRVEELVMGAALKNGAIKNAPPSPYRMRLELSNLGASIASATMTDHAATLDSDERYQLLAPVERDDGTRWQSFSVEKINIDGVDVPLANRKWHVGTVEPYENKSGSGQRISFSLDIHEQGAPALRLTRTFALPKQPTKLGRHDLDSSLTVENLSAQPHQVLVTYRGGLGVRSTPAARMDDRYVDFGLWDGTRVNGDRTTPSAVGLEAALTKDLYEPDPGDPKRLLSWAATANTYFTALIAPRNRNQTDNATYLSHVSAIDLDGSAATDDDVTLRFVSRMESIPAGGTLAYPADIYLGEKDGDAFRAVESYTRRNYYFQISQSFGACTFGFLVELMIWLLNTIHILTRDYGLAIIAVVLIVRTLLHPITKKGQVNMVRMQKTMGKFAPKIEELKKKFGNDKARMQQETMKLYREHGINPATQMLSCLPMMLQMPIWVALFLSLSNNIALRHQGFLFFPWIDDLTAADALYTFTTPLIVPLVGWELPSFNLLPLFVALFMYIQQKLQPKPAPNPSATDQQKAQQEMMQKMGPMMSIMMLLFFYKMPAGLNLYIMFSSLFGAIEQHRIRKHIKEHEEAGTLLKPAKTSADRLSKRERTGKMSFVEKLQKMAEEAQKAQPPHPGKGKKKT